MNAPSSSSIETSPPVVETRLPAAVIDASCRWTLLLLFTSGVLWLALGLLLSFVVSMKLHVPAFLADGPWLTLGRVRPAAMNCLLYGFASQLSIGVMLWLMCRLGGTRLMFQWPVIVAWKFWNIAVTIGVIAILAGAGTGFEWLEMPRAAAGILFISYAVIGLCAAATFTMRRQRELFPSQWYLLAAMFWFPWIYSAANYLLVLDPVRGTMQAVVNAWFTGNFVGLWLAPVALAGIFYFLPKLTGQPLYSRELAVFGFWTLAFFTNWSGLTGLSGGPVPSWLPAVSTAATVCLLVPLLCHGLNWHLTCRACCVPTPHPGPLPSEGRGRRTGGEADRNVWRNNPILCFILLGALCYLLHGLASIVLALPQVAAITNLTYAPVARNYLAILGFGGSVLFGGVYYIVPRVTQVEWPNARWIRFHLLSHAIGVALLVFALGLGGLVQGSRLGNPSVPFINVVTGTVPFIGLSTLAWLILLAGHGLFLANFCGLLRRFIQPAMAAACDFCGCLPDSRATAKVEVKA